MHLYCTHDKLILFIVEAIDIQNKTIHPSIEINLEIVVETSDSFKQIQNFI